MTVFTPSTYNPQAQPRVGRRTGFLDWICDIASVLIIITFSQGWIAPIFGATSDAADGSLIRMAYFPAYLAGLMLLALNAGDAIKVLIRQPLLLAIMGLVIASITWSISPGETMRRTVAISFTTLAGVSLAARYTWPRLVEVMGAAFAILCALSFLMCVAVPSIGKMGPGSEFPGAWRGLWAEKNSLGDNMALFMPAFIAAAIYHPRRRGLWIGAAVLCLSLLVMSTSKTSLLGLMLVLAATAYVALVRRGPALAVALTWLAVVSVSCVVGAVILFPAESFALLGKDATLTGRTEIWAAIMTQANNHPWLGHGYGTVWTDESPWGPLAWIVREAHFRPYHAHSSWYEQLLGLGWIGLFTWAAFLAQSLITAAVSAFRDRGAFVALPFIVVYVLISLTESITLTYNDVRWVLFVAIACKMAYPDGSARA